MIIRAALLCPKPIISTKLKYCKISTTKEKINVKIAMLIAFILMKALMKLYMKITTKISPTKGRMILSLMYNAIITSTKKMITAMINDFL